MSDITITTRAPVQIERGAGIVVREMDDLYRLAKAVHAGGFAPKGMNEAGCFVAMAMGMELGMSAFQGLQNIAVINGRPGVFGDAALAVCRGSSVFESYSQTMDGEGDNRKAIVISKRRGETAMITEFSVADAKRAKLWGKDGPWSQYPERMLLYRARGFNLRDNFGDVLKGLKTSEELQDIPALDEPSRFERAEKPAEPTFPPQTVTVKKPEAATTIPEPTWEERFLAACEIRGISRCISDAELRNRTGGTLAEHLAAGTLRKVTALNPENMAESIAAASKELAQ